MQDFKQQAEELINSLPYMSKDEMVKLAENALNSAYNLGKKHLIEPHIICDGNHVVTIEKDTYNPQA